jgi:hypothetical protein
LARYEGDFRGDAKEQLSLEELVALLASVNVNEEQSRRVAIACALSASEGWEEAVRQLGGAFAEEATGLKARKDAIPTG